MVPVTSLLLEPTGPDDQITACAVPGVKALLLESAGEGGVVGDAEGECELY